MFNSFSNYKLGKNLQKLTIEYLYLSNTKFNNMFQ
jgi:hypothetical protein